MKGRLAIAARKVVSAAAPAGGEPAAVLVRDGKIESVVPRRAIPRDCELVDLGDKVLLPALVDTHVHVNEPGRTEWEGFETATKAAAAGGIGTIVDMPLNSIPVTTTLDALKTKIAAARERLWVDCAFWGGVIPGHRDELETLIDAGVAGFKCFLIDSGIPEFPAVREEDLRAAMPVLARRGAPLLVHAELDCGAPAPRGRRYGSFLSSRPKAWENAAIDLMIRLCRETGCRVHIVHLSSADALPALRKAKDEGLPVTAETCPHYLCFCAEEIVDGRTDFKCAPPIRERENRDRLWGALEEGVIDFVVSDHSPCTPRLKALEAGDFEAAWGGISSVQFSFSAVWTEARARGVAFEDVVRWMAAAPAAFAGLEPKGRIAAGCDADFAVVDPSASFVVRPEIVRHRHKLTPYNGRALFGKIEQTFLRGERIYDHGTFAGPFGIARSRLG